MYRAILRPHKFRRYVQLAPPYLVDRYIPRYQLLADSQISQKREETTTHGHLTGLHKHNRKLKDVPPKPKEPEPDNCCMSGCVNCVWDIYRQEMEEWTAAQNTLNQKHSSSESSGDKITEGANFDNSPAAVGLRALMEMERALKKKKVT